MENTRLSFLFYRYVNNRCSDAERQELFMLLNHPDHEEQVRHLMEEVWNDVTEERLSAEKYESIIHNILSQGSARKRVMIPWGRVAAVFLIAALFAASTSLWNTNFFVMNGSSVQVVTPAPMPNFTKLPDGSTVILNANSKLEFPKVFGQEKREVFLEGEGFFDIVEDSSRPFIVHTGELRTTVLGTAFNIKAWPDQRNIVVTVKRGRVQVGSENQTLGVVTPDQQITFDRSLQVLEQSHVDSHLVTSWIEKDILFDDVTMREAIDQLERRFEVRIGISNEVVEGCRFTATFIKGESLEQILVILCEFNNATLVAREAGYEIVGGACSWVKEEWQAFRTR